MKVFGLNKPIIGMIHVDALPATPNYKGDIKNIIKNAVSEAKTYISAGIDALMIENMHDVPYLNRSAGPEIIAMMSILAYEVKNCSNVPVGIQILAGANKQALASALASGADFIRAEGFVYAHIADEGFFNSDAGELLRYRKAINAEHIAIFTDIKKKHSSHSLTADTTILETAKAAEFFLSDGVIITGSSTGIEPSLEEIKVVKENVNIPVISGSGITDKNFDKYYEFCDAMIIGSHFKIDGSWMNTLDKKRIRGLLSKVKR